MSLKRLILTLYLLSHTVWAANLYVTTTGNNSNPCSQASPCLTIQHALDIVNAGDTVLVANGSYVEADHITRDGTAGSPIIIKSINKWGAKIVPTSTAGNSGYSFYFGASYVTLQDFEITGTPTTGAGVKIDSGTNNFILGNNVHDIGVSSSVCTGGGGILVAAANGTVKNNFIWNVSPPRSAGFRCNQQHGVYLTDGSAGAIVQNNIIFEIWQGYGVQIYADDSNLTVTNNTLFNIGDNGHNSGGGFVFSCITSGVTCNNIKFNNNILMNVQVNGIYECGVSGCGTAGTYGANNVYQNNLEYLTDANLFQGNGTATGTVTTNPAFVNYTGDQTGNYHLQSSSPAIDAGVSNGAPSTDYEGNARPFGATYDIGAFEGVSTAGNYYISTTGSDANPGTLASPWATWGKADTSAIAGDTIHVLPGTYTLSTLYTTKDGTPGNPVTWKSEIKGAAKIVGTSPQGTNQSVWDSSGDWVTIDGFDITGVGRYALITRGSNVIVKNNIVHNLPAGGTCTEGAGILAYYLNGTNRTSNVSIIGNIVHHIGDPNVNCNSVHGISHTTVGGVVQNNIVYHVQGFGIALYDDPENINVSNNLVWDNGLGGINVSGLGGGLKATSLNITNNIAINNGYSYSSVSVMAEGINTVAPIVWKNNLLFGNKTNTTNAIVGTVSGTVTADPRLGDLAGLEFHPSSSSPTINAGTSVGAPTSDFDGTVRPLSGAYDIGPYEYVTVGTSTNYPKISQTTKTIQTANNTSFGSWPEGATPAWSGCGGLYCKIDTFGIWTCDGTSPTNLTFCNLSTPRPANVSGSDDGVSVKQMLYSGATTIITPHFMGWFCTVSRFSNGDCNAHMQVGIDSNTAAQATSTLKHMKMLGFDGIEIDWEGQPYGTTSLPLICSAGNQKKKCYRDEPDLKIRDALNNDPQFAGFLMSLVYDHGAPQDCLNNPNPTNCGRCDKVNDLATTDDTLQHCSNAPATACTTNAGCPTGGTCHYDGCTINDKIANDLDYANTQYFSSSHYQKNINGRPIVYLFDISGGGLSWTKIRAAIASNPVIIDRFKDGNNPLTSSTTDGGWTWQGRSPSNAYGYTTKFLGQLGELTGCNGARELPADHGTGIVKCASDKSQLAPSKFFAASFFGHHDNRSAGWAVPNGGSAPIKIDPPMSASTWVNSFAAMNTKWSSANQLKYASVITWDDIDESSGVGPGFVSGWRFQAGSPYLTGSLLNWVIEKYDVDGAGPATIAEATTAVLDHFRLFVSGAAISPASYSGDALYQATNVSISSGTCSGNTCSYSYDLSTLGLNGGTSYINLKLVGKAGVQTKFSPRAYFVTGGGTTPNNPPVVTLSLTPTSGTVSILTTATISATDSDGTISSSSIDWGDGTVDTTTGLTTKTHTYTVPNGYTVVFSATDNGGAVSTTTQSFTANPSSAPGSRRHKPREGM